jgi:hypothetical protein
VIEIANRGARSQGNRTKFAGNHDPKYLDIHSAPDYGKFIYEDYATLVIGSVVVVVVKRQLFQRAEGQ